MKRDPFFVVILTGLGAVVVWLLLTPFVPSVARTTMERFHLRGDSFTKWAVQAPIPAMYNFANRFQIREVPDDFDKLMPIFQLAPQELDEPQWRYINHFPPRLLTFANTRYKLLDQGEDRWVTIETSYRGQRIETEIHAKPIENGFEWVAREVEDDGRD
ncbi:MAG: hypothetical protein AAFU85_26450 [Planctomycetota bacterium]